MSKLFRKFSIFTVLICVFTFTGIISSKAIAYDNSTFSGPWIGCEDSNSAYHVPCIYMVPDGRGVITDMGIFYPPDVINYNVSPNGRLEVNVHGIAFGTGQLRSNTTGYLDFIINESGQTVRYDIAKVNDVGIAQGNWVGNFGGHGISIGVDRNGVVQNFSGLGNLVSGRIYSNGLTVAGFFRTDTPNKFNQIAISGTLSDNVLAGVFETDSNDRLQSFSLTRQVGPSPSPELTYSEKANIIFNWLESLFPSILSPSPQQTHVTDNIYFRYYPGTNVYLGVIDNDLYYYDEWGVLHNLDSIDIWLALAQEQ